MFIVMYHVVLIGIAPLIPIPFLDDALITFLWQHMVSGLANSHTINLNKSQIKQLNHQSKFACSDGCLFIINRIVRQFIPWWEWSRGVSLATDAYYTGYLLNELFSSGIFDSNKVDKYSIAIGKAREQVNVNLVKGAIVSTFRSGRGIVISITRWLSRLAMSYIKATIKLVWRLAKDFWYRKSRDENEESRTAQAAMGNLFEDDSPKFENLINELASHLQDGIGKLPTEHFTDLRSKMFNELSKLESLNDHTEPSK